MSRRWPGPALLLLLLVGSIAMVRSWPDPSKTQTLATAFGFVASVVLVYITVLYVRTNQQTLELMRKQWDEQRKVYLVFGLDVENERPTIWIANLGMAHFMVKQVRLRTPTGELQEFDEDLLIGPGMKEKLPIPDEIVERAHLSGDLDLTLYYQGPGGEGGSTESTGAQAYNLITAHGRATKVRKGFHDLRPIKCPKCKKSQEIFMIPKELHNEDEAYQRQKEMERDMSDSCPTHASKWRASVN